MLLVQLVVIGQTCENSADSRNSAEIHVSQAVYEIYINSRRTFLGFLGGGGCGYAKQSVSKKTPCNHINI